MSIGNILLRPQPLTRSNIDRDSQAMDLFMGLASRFAEDFARRGNASQKIVTAIQTEMNAFISGVEPRLSGSNTKIMAWLAPWMSSVEGIKNTNFNNSSDILSLIEKIIELTIKILEDLHSDKIASRLNDLADIVENDLGISYGTFENLFNAFFDRIVDALAENFLKGLQTEEAVNHFALSRQMLTLRHFLKNLVQQAPLPTFNRRTLILELQLQLEANGWNDRLDEVRNQIDSLKDKLPAILPLIQQAFNAGSVRGVGANAQLSWYASWFLGDPTAVSDPFNLQTEPFAGDMGLGAASLPIGTTFLEYWAHATYAATEVAKAVIYGFQIQKDSKKGNKIGPGLNMSWEIAMAIISCFAFVPSVKGDTWADFYKIKNKSIFQKGLTELLTLGGSFEQYPGKFRDWFWDNYLNARDNLSDGKEYPEMAYDFFLSLFTLINRDGKNHEKIDGFTALGRKAGTTLAAFLMGRKERYQSIGLKNFGSSVLHILLGGAVTFACEVISWLLAGAVARKISGRYWRFEDTDFIGGVEEFFGDENAYSAFLLYSYQEFYSDWGSFWDGKTDDGKFGVKFTTLPSNGDGIRRDEVTFNGYPDKSTSPYLLPFPKDQSVLCIQSHQGFSSHNFLHGLIYAVDFQLKPGDKVLAMRDGVVESYVDIQPAAGSEDKNYILIRHDPQIPGHDRGEGGNVVTTWSRYEHPEADSVATQFELRGISEPDIIGSRVHQGDVIMKLAERPGFFETNNLHVQVLVKDGDSVPYPSIPFVFKDIPDDGVPEKGKYYVSANSPGQ